MAGLLFRTRNIDEQEEEILYIYYEIPVTFFSAFTFRIPINVCTSVIIVFLKNT
jgi:hypothetical protein